ncbi:nucleoside phosphorylase domain-containing protein [Aspergillus carlsbadensis]|nr:nucleoside phosphorylase domain-containing protein [Aspergillus carlsbadensis]
MQQVTATTRGLLARATASSCAEDEVFCHDGCVSASSMCCADGGSCRPGYRCAMLDGVPVCELDVASPSASPSPVPVSVSSGLKTAEIAGIAVGCGVAVLLTILALFLLHRRRRRTKRATHEAKETLPHSAVAPQEPPRSSFEICPSSRDEFEIALVCALRLEYDAVCLLFDTFWDEAGDRFGRAPGDCNTYTTGRIGRYNVVLALLPNMGKVSAASAAASLHHSYRGLRLAILVGICGGVPFPVQDAKRDSDNADSSANIASAKEILLGDVVISQKVIQYDLGKRYPSGFVRRDTVEDNLSRPNKDIRSLLALLETELGRERLQQGTAGYLVQLQDAARARNRRAGYVYPGTGEDMLFASGYRHKHHGSEKLVCACKDCHQASDPVCESALTSTCAELHCAASQLIPRRRLKQKASLEPNADNQTQLPTIHIGQIASGDTVIKSGMDRDVLAREMNVIAFEMEGAGVWDQLPCIIVKGVADYADCHKNDAWQDFAAAVAAAAMKALLDRYVRTDRGASPRI